MRLNIDNENVFSEQWNHFLKSIDHFNCLWQFILVIGLEGEFLEKLDVICKYIYILEIMIYYNSVYYLILIFFMSSLKDVWGYHCKHDRGSDLDLLE